VKTYFDKMYREVTDLEKKAKAIPKKEAAPKKGE